MIVLECMWKYSAMYVVFSFKKNLSAGFGVLDVTVI